DRADRARYLRNLPEEQRHVREAMEAAVEAGLCEVVERANATVDEILDVFQDPEYRDRVAVFHFGGHAGDAELLLESAGGEATVAHAGGLARFLGEQRGLELVFLNGCSSRGQVQGLLDAGVPAVIATSQAIDDAVATELSGRFYKALASGASVRTAYTEAQAAVQIRRGDSARGAYRSFVPDVVAEDRWPWDLYVAPGAEERLVRWSLPLAAHDPLFGLPPLPAMDLPASPFKHLSWFGREDAHVFFGRGREIRDLYEAVTRPEAEPIVLLFGATGVGKSSLLAAGLAPRLEASHEVVYLRRDSTLGLPATLAKVLETPGGADLGAAWRAHEEASGRPLVVILDQAEEAWTRPVSGGSGGKEPEETAAALRSIFGVREKRPRGRLILGFRKEWLAEVLRLVDGEKLPRFRVEIAHLDRDAIAEAIAGPARDENLQRYYHLEVEPQLPEIVADDLLEDRGAAIAPALQILLTKMWALATKESPDAPRFTVELYQRLKRGGILLDDFLGEQLESLRQWRPELVGSGLVLDLLGFHTTALGTAETRPASEVLARYGGRPEVEELLLQCQDRYLLSAGEGTTRLAHDTLAPLVRRRFEASDLPGQRASRILEQRAVEWAGGKDGTPLDDVDLATVEQGAGGMRAWTADEKRLVEKSRSERARRRRLRRVQQWAAVFAFLAITAAAGYAWQQRAIADKEARTARRVTAFLKNLFQNLDPYEIALDKNGLPQILDRSRENIEKNLADEPEAQDRLRETIGVVDLNLGRLGEAEALLEKVVAFRRRQLGEEHPDTLLAKNELGNIYSAQARRKEAEELFDQVLDGRRRKLGPENPQTLETMNNLATVYRDQGRWKEAEKLNDRVIGSYRRTLGEKNPDTLKVMENQANLYALQGRLGDAEELSRKVLETRRRVLPPTHPDTLHSMTSLAIIVSDRGRLKEAEELDRHALEVSTKTLGGDHPDTLMYMTNLANVLYEENRLTEAEAMYDDILKIELQKLGQEHPDTLAAMNNRAAILQDLGRLKEAEALLRKVYGTSSRARGPEHPDTLTAMSNLATAYQAQGRLDEAESLERQALALQSKVLGKEHPMTLRTMNNLGLLSQQRGHLKEAESLLHETAAAMRRVLGDESPYTLSAMNNLAGLYHEEGRLKEEEDLRRQIREIQHRQEGAAPRP
ncbi:MAG TPA: tetratricopeptide repeat protein, partial [Thermoanaerobaculia bacterium]|nr:tetratricopeptide repeat protein [Thermoanaerobaculia bacterium]